MTEDREVDGKKGSIEGEGAGELSRLTTTIWILPRTQYRLGGVLPFIPLSFFSIALCLCTPVALSAWLLLIPCCCTYLWNRALISRHSDLVSPCTLLSLFFLPLPPVLPFLWCGTLSSTQSRICFHVYTHSERPHSLTFLSSRAASVNV